jgi:hypothetical protein
LRSRQFSGPALSDAERAKMMAVVALREIREELRDEGMEPPLLPEPLKWLDN